jgi:hypothetical protein
MSRRALFSVLFLAAAACGGQADEDTFGTSSDRAFVSPAGNRWLDLDGVNVPVCWVMPPDGPAAANGYVDDDVKAAVRDALVVEYNGRTEAKLGGFADCTAEDAARAVIRLRFETKTVLDGPRSFSHPGGLGWVGPVAQKLSTENAGAGLAWSSATAWFGAPRSWAKASNFIKTATLRAALHEVGHGLGLLHEHERPDAPNCPRAGDGQRSTDTSALEIGAYDAASIMNYCSTTQTPTLSDGDVRAVSFLFTAKWPSLTSLSTSGRGETVTVTLRGKNFDATTTVEVNGTTTAVQSFTDTSLTFVVPSATLSGAVRLQVVNRNADGEALRSSEVTYRFR